MEIIGQVDPELPRRIWWPWDQPAERVGFWADFEADQSCQGSFNISCSGEYTAWLDGRKIPAVPSQLPSWRSMHKILLDLSSGKHRLCVEARPGPNTQSFLLASLDWQAASESGQPGKFKRLATGSGWWMAADPPAGWQDFIDELNGRPAWAFDGVWAEPWGFPCNAPDDYCRMSTGWQRMQPDTVQRLAGVFPGVATLMAKVDVFPDGSTAFFPAEPYPISLPAIELARPRLEWYRSREAHSLINNSWLDLFESRSPHVVFDVGVETFARLRIRLRSGGPAFLAVTTGESLNEVQRYARRVTDLFRLEDGQEFLTSPSGFRYVKVLALGAGSPPICLEPVEVQHIRYPVALEGTFECSDEFVNTVYNLSRRTLHLCMQNEIWDGIKRDQLPWMGDLYTEALAAYHLFGDTRLARRTLAVLAEIGPAPAPALELQHYPGLTAIWKIPGGDMNNIPSYTLWWLAGLWDYYQYSGDTSLIVECASELEAILKHIADWVGSDGIWRLQGGWDFVDWAPLSEQDRAKYCHLLAARVLGYGARLLQAIGHPSVPFQKLQIQMMKAARLAWWDRKDRDPGLSLGHSHHVIAQAICSGVFTRSECLALFESFLKPDPPMSMTYWHRFLDLMAAQEVGDVAWGLEMIRKHWGQSVQLGTSTLWEAFDPAWLGADPHAVSMVGAGYARYGGYETSLCHGWSAGPAAWLHTAVLGIRPHDPGFRSFTFTPDLGDLEWARGDIPTPHGPIHVYLERGLDGKMVCQLESPPEISRVTAR